jgi:hypothetical protein
MNYPGGFKHITYFDSANGALARFLYPFAWRDSVFLFDDFWGDAIQAPWWTAAATNGTAFDEPATQLESGVTRGITGTGAVGDETMLTGEAIWSGNNQCGLEVRWKADVVTDTKMQVGFTDPTTNNTSSIINDIDTPTIQNGATDVALVGQDTSQTLTTMAFITDGSGTNMNTTKTNLGTRVPTAATYLGTRIQLTRTATNVAASKCVLLDATSGITDSAFHGDVVASQINGAILVKPWFYWENVTNATALTIDIDYVAIWQDRASS